MSLHLSKYTQNAWQTKRPEEMVGCIHYVTWADVAAVDNPLADAVFMAQIGAKKLISEANDSHNYSEYELRNAATGTRFTFSWYTNFVDGSYSFWHLRKWNNL